MYRDAKYKIVRDCKGTYPYSIYVWKCDGWFFPQWKWVYLTSNSTRHIAEYNIDKLSKTEEDSSTSYYSRKGEKIA